MLYKFLDDRKDIQCPNGYDMVNVRRLLDDVAPELDRAEVGERQLTRSPRDRTTIIYGDYVEGNKAAQDIIGSDKVSGDKTVNNE